LKTIRILRPGLCATVQDRGRFGFQDRGIPLSGAMDPWAYRLGNVLVGNSEDAASLEITLGGFEAEILRDVGLAVTGTTAGIRLNERPVPLWSAVEARSGDRLTIPYARKGARDYLSLSGGVDVPLIMGSRSTYLRGGVGGLRGRALRKGDVIESGPPQRAALKEQVPPALIPPYGRRFTLRVVPGPQDDEISDEGTKIFFGGVYTVTLRSDRMGCVLEGPEVRHKKGADIISDGTAFGSIQVPGSGRPIILMADRQTTGGYVKIATVITVDLPLIAQALPGYEVHFQAVTVQEAQELLREREKALENYLATTLH
jgi:antagonist of KipI